MDFLDYLPRNLFAERALIDLVGAGHQYELLDNLAPPWAGHQCGLLDDLAPLCAGYQYGLLDDLAPLSAGHQYELLADWHNGQKLVLRSAGSP